MNFDSITEDNFDKSSYCLSNMQETELFSHYRNLSNFIFQNENNTYKELSGEIKIIESEKKEEINNFIKNNIIIDNSKNKKFITTKIDKKSNNLILKKKRKHYSSSLDNMKTKIQVHFFSFIINISNDALLTEFNKKKRYNFKRIDYKVKQKANNELFEKLKNSSIKNVIKMNISPKCKKYSIDHNIKILNKVYNISNWLDKFFDMNYLRLFNYYYNNHKPLTKILFKGKEIKFSKKTKCFYDLLEKNPKDKNDLIDTIKTEYNKGCDILFFIK